MLNFPDEASEFLDPNTEKLCRIFLRIYDTWPPPLFQYSRYTLDQQLNATKQWRAFYTTAQHEAWELYFRNKDL